MYALDILYNYIGYVYTPCIFPLLDEKPKLPDLLSFRTATGATVNICSRVGDMYTMLGVLLLQDEDGALVQAIVSQHLLNASNITLDILSRWLRGEGKQPVTWQTLTDTLKDVGLVELASSILESL